jgi:hypothetical protein
MKTPGSFFKFIVALSIATISLGSCKKDILDVVNSQPEADNKGFREYVIKAGQHYSNQSGYFPISLTEMKFIVRFNESAIYSTRHEHNKRDINKLFGFSDNSKQHHEYSARFGWRYMDDKLTLHAYVYNNGKRVETELGQIQLNKDYTCSIKVSGGKYIFTLDGKSTQMNRSALTAKAEGYKLFPYFGGDETAPHDIKILIREEN